MSAWLLPLSDTRSLRCQFALGEGRCLSRDAGASPLCSLARSMAVVGLVGGPAQSYASGMEEFVVLLAALELGLFTVCVMAGFAMGRRSHFWARVFVGCLSWLAIALSVGSLVAEHALGLVVFGTFMAALFVVPPLSCQSLDPPPGGADHDDGGGSGPDRPPASSEPPRGGVPLPDADPSGIRLTRPQQSEDPLREPVAFAGA